MSDTKQPMAFPQHFNTAVKDGMGGMTLRDYFAAMAMQGFLANSEPCGFEHIWVHFNGHDEKDGSSRRAAGAKLFYQMADAMLKARESS